MLSFQSGRPVRASGKQLQVAPIRFKWPRLNAILEITIVINFLLDPLGLLDPPLSTMSRDIQVEYQYREFVIIIDIDCPGSCPRWYSWGGPFFMS